MVKKRDLERIFGGRDNEPITEELIKELLSSTEFTEKEMRFFQKQGCTYCRPRNSFVGAPVFSGSFK